MQSGSEEQIIIFQLSGQSYGFYLKEVKEVIEPGPLSFIPKVPSFFSGIMNHQGRVILVVDLRTLLQLSSTGENGLPRILLVGGPEAEVGFLVGQVKKITSFSEEGSKVLAHNENRYVKEVIKWGESIINILEVKRIVDDLESFL